MKTLLTLVVLAASVNLSAQNGIVPSRLFEIGRIYTLGIESTHKMTGTVTAVDSQSVWLSTGEREVKIHLARITKVAEKERNIYLYPPEVYGDTVACFKPQSPEVQQQEAELYIPDALVRQGRITLYGDFGLTALYVGYFAALAAESKVFVSKNKDHLVDVHGGIGDCGGWNTGDFDVVYGGLGYSYRFAKIRTRNDFLGFLIEVQAELAHLYNGSFTQATDHYLPFFEWGIRAEFQNWGPMFHASLNSTFGASAGVGFRF